ncbi:hypothetical protein A5777_06695 [Gordonia sp. 852002-10350_SCH5691597]|nr:hypothetical protein A5777_06695 [Gordonia sp. 852002-10350_SCH5691597]
MWIIVGVVGDAMEEPSVSELLAHNVRAMRKQREWSQEQLAERMSKNGHQWHQATVYKVESGSRSVTYDEAYSLSELFGVSMEMLGSLGGVDVAVVGKRMDDVVDARSKLAIAHSQWRWSKLLLRRTVLEEESTKVAERTFAQYGVEYLPGVLDRLPSHMVASIRAMLSQTAQDVIDSEPPF